MSSEVYYGYSLLERRKKELEKQIELEKQQAWEKQLELYEKIVKNNDRVIKIYSESKDEYSKKHKIEGWKSLSSETKVFCNERVKNKKLISYSKDKKVDLLNIAEDKKERKYVLNDLFELPVKNDCDLIRKREMIIKLNSSAFTDEEVNNEIKNFISKIDILNANELSIVNEYNFIMNDMNKNKQEKSFEKIKNEIENVRRQYEIWREKKYINESLVRIMKEEGIIFDEENICDGVKCGQYRIENYTDVALQVKEMPPKSLLVEFVGIKVAGSTPSDETKNEAVEKAKYTCKKVNRVCLRLLEECGISMHIKDFCYPNAEKIKYVEKNRNEKNKYEKVKKRVMYEV